MNAPDPVPRRKKLTLTPHEDLPMGPMLMTLSVFVMLLSFFMVLNATSRFVPERVKPALKSITETFSTRIFNEGAGRDTDEIGAPLSENKDAYRSLDQYFRASFPDATQRVVPSRGFLYLEVSLAEFQRKLFRPQSSMQTTLLEKLWAYPNLQMEIWLQVQGDASPSSPETSKAGRDAAIRLSEWAANLEANGLKKENLTIGVKTGDPEKVLVLFHNYKPYVPGP